MNPEVARTRSRLHASAECRSQKAVSVRTATAEKVGPSFGRVYYQEGLVALI